MSAAGAPAKINLALVVGPARADGKHEVLTVMQTVGIADDVVVEPAAVTEVRGFADDTIVTQALCALASEAGAPHGWRVTITKRIPVAAGLGGGSADAGTALRLANEQLGTPLPTERLAAVAARIGADVPFFLAGGTQLGTGDGSTVEPVSLPLDYAVVLALPKAVVKPSTAAVYAAFDGRHGERGFEARAVALRLALAEVGTPVDLARLPPNDLASSPLAGRLLALGAFRADVSGAGPCVYGLFVDANGASAAARQIADEARTWVTAPLPRREP